MGLLSFRVGSARVWGLTLPTCVLEQDGVVSWESLGSSGFIIHKTSLKWGPTELRLHSLMSCS